MHAVITRRWRALTLLVAIVMLASACTVKLQVEVDVAEDGSGVVTAGVGLDDAALVRAPDLVGLLVTDDLTGAGWSVAAPLREEDGRTWVRAEKPFASEDELQAVLDELFGPGAVFQDFEIVRDSSTITERFELGGVVDLTDGLAVFTDEGLVETLGVEPLGIDADALSIEFGVPIEDTVSTEVVVRLPLGEEQRFDVPLGERIEIAADGESVNRVAQVVGWVRMALVALLGLSLLLAALNYLLDRRRAAHRPEKRPGRLASRVPGANPDEPFEAGDPQPQMQMMVLDAHDVLFRWPADPAAHIVPFVLEHGSTLGRDEIVELHRQATLGRMRSPAFWEACGVVGDPETLDAKLLADVRLQQGAREFLREMHRRGVPIAVVTNDLADWSNALRDLHGLGGVAPWIVSSDIGVRKPDPAAFEALRRITGVPYFSMVIVDAQIPSLDTARTLGAMTAWFARHRPADEADPGHAVITKFGDFFRRRRPAEPVPAGRGRRR